MDFQGLVGALFGGFVGGNLAGSFVKPLSLGTLGDTLTGLLGGLIGLHIMQRRFGLVLSSSVPIDVVGFMSHVAAGCAGGAMLMLAVALLRKVGRSA